VEASRRAKTKDGLWLKEKARLIAGAATPAVRLETALDAELTATEVREYKRPNLFTNTPDILHEYLQFGGRAAFQIRLVLAATPGARATVSVRGARRAALVTSEGHNGWIGTSSGTKTRFSTSCTSRRTATATATGWAIFAG
jgi:hypothetical protein